MVIQYQKSGTETIVEQHSQVEFRNDDIYLKRAHHKFIKLGNAINDALLDTQVLKVTQDRNCLEGLLFFDNKQIKVNVRFIREPLHKNEAFSAGPLGV